MVLLLQVVGNVELWLVVGCHSPTEVADGEVGQIGHAADAGSPLVDGIAIGENDDIATTQRLQHFTLEHTLVADCHPRHLRKGKGAEQGILGTLDEGDKAVRIARQQVFAEQA